MTANKITKYLTHFDGSRIAYQKLNGSGPTLVFLSGFMSNMMGDKANAFSEYCHKTDHAFVRFDYSGHGLSDKQFIDCTLSQWINDALLVLDNLTTGSVILVGSSMGGWIATHCAIARPEKVVGLIGLAAAPDFTETLITEGQKTTLLKTGSIQIWDNYSKSTYLLTHQFFEDSQQHLLLNQDINLDIPVKLIHGIKDADVPWKTAISLQKHLTSDDVDVYLIKNGDHRLSSPQHLELILNNVNYFLEKF